MATTQIRGSTQIQAGTILDAQISPSAAIASSKLADGANFLKKDGSVALTGDLNANSHKITSLATPTASGDATNKSYVDGLDGANLKKDGSVALTGDLNANSHKITSLATPTVSGDATNKSYVDGLDAADLKKDGSVALTGSLNANSHKIINLSAPTSNSDAANKSYVDGVASGLQLKTSVRVATTANITLSGAQTIDGVAVVAGNRVLVKNQTAGEDNGIYVVVDPGAWTRSADLDEPSELTAGIFTFVEEGTVNADNGWVLITDNPVVLGTDPQTWAQFSGAGSVNAGAGLTQTGSTLDVVSANDAIVVNADNIELTLADASLQIVAGGIRVTAGGPGQVLVADGSGEIVAQTLTGDVASVSSAGDVALASTIVRKVDFTVREVPTGTINGSNAVFTLANPPVLGSEQVFLNGLLLSESGVGNDYTISTATITLASAPLSGDLVVVTYLK